MTMSMRAVNPASYSALLSNQTPRTVRPVSSASVAEGPDQSSYLVRIYQVNPPTCCQSLSLPASLSLVPRRLLASRIAASSASAAGTSTSGAMPSASQPWPVLGS